MSPLQNAVEIVGGQVALARILGGRVRQGHVWQWLNRNWAPAEYCRAIESATEGKVTRYDLRPDVFGPAPADQQKEAA